MTPAERMRKHVTELTGLRARLEHGSEVWERIDGRLKVAQKAYEDLRREEEGQLPNPAA